MKFGLPLPVQLSGVATIDCVYIKVANQTSTQNTVPGINFKCARTSSAVGLSGKCSFF